MIQYIRVMRELQTLHALRLAAYLQQINLEHEFLPSKRTPYICNCGISFPRFYEWKLHVEAMNNSLDHFFQIEPHTEIENG